MRPQARSSLGRHTVVLAPTWVATELGRWWWAVWESGSGAALDGVTALQAAGLRGWQESALHVNVPPPNACYRNTGVRVHRRRVMGSTIGGGPPRCRLELATIRAAQWAVSERQAPCRRHGLPEPRRQSVRQGRLGRLYLDAEFDDGLVVEIDGGQHLLGLAPVDDALRANEVTLTGSRVLRIPCLVCV